MSANLEVIEYWRGQDVLEEIEDGVDYGFAYAAMDAVTLDKATTPVNLGNLQRSKKTAAPDYMTNDFDAAVAGDLALTDVEAVRRQVVDHQLAFGSWLPYAYLVETGTAFMPGRPSTVTAGDAVAGNMDQYVRTGIQHTQQTI